MYYSLKDGRHYTLSQKFSRNLPHISSPVTKQNWPPYVASGLATLWLGLVLIAAGQGTPTGNTPTPSPIVKPKQAGSATLVSSTQSDKTTGQSTSSVMTSTPQQSSSVSSTPKPAATTTTEPQTEIGGRGGETAETMLNMPAPTASPPSTTTVPQPTDPPLIMPPIDMTPTNPIPPTDPIDVLQ